MSTVFFVVDALGVFRQRQLRKGLLIILPWDRERERARAREREREAHTSTARKGGKGRAG
jgi:hypothetical protein